MRKRSKDGWVLLGLIAASLVLARFQTNARSQGRTDPLGQLVRTMVKPAANGMAAAHNFSSDLASGFLSGPALREENRRLKEQLSAISQDQQRVADLESEVDELRKLGAWERLPGRQKIPADVIGYFPHENRLTLSIGSAQGVIKGLPVVYSQGYIGRVETVEQNSCQVVLVTASSAKIGAIVRRPKPNPASAGLLHGQGVNQLILEFADPTAQVQVGDAIVTSGFSEQIPRGLEIGRVIRVEDDEAFGKRTAIIFPKVAVGELREVLVLR